MLNQLIQRYGIVKGSMADVDVDEDAAGRDSDTGEESSNSGQPGSKVQSWSGLREGDEVEAEEKRANDMIPMDEEKIG